MPKTGKLLIKRLNRNTTNLPKIELTRN